MKRMTRFHALLIEFGGMDIPLALVAEKYLDLSSRRADEKAAKHQLPFKTYRAGSQKSPRMVNAYDLASHIDAIEKQAAAEHDRLHA